MDLSHGGVAFHNICLGLTLTLLLGSLTAPFSEEGKALDRVLELIDRQEFEGAAAEARKLISQDPTSARAHAFLGYALEFSGKISMAEEAYRRSIEMDSVFLLPRLQLGLLYAKQKRYQECVSTLGPVREKILEDAEALFYLTQCYFETGAPQQALQIAEDLENRHMADGGALLSVGNLLLSKGYSGQAARVLRRATQQIPGSFPAHYSLGLALYQMGDEAEAVKALAEASRLNPNSSKANVSYAMALVEIGDHAAAEEFLRRALALDPGNDNAAFLLGKIFLDRKLYGQGLEWLQKAIQLDPGNPNYHFMLVEAYYLNEDSQEALEHSLLLRELFPQYPRSHLNVGMQLHFSGEFEKAKKSLERSIKIARAKEPSEENLDSWTQAALHLASILRKEGNFSEAVLVLHEVLRTRPKPEVYIELSRCYVQGGEPRKAVTLLGKAIDLEPQDLEARFLLGTALARMGEIERAQKEFEIFSELSQKQDLSKFISSPVAKPPDE